jgi:hypothetical protein
VCAAPAGNALANRDIQNDNNDDATVMKANVNRKRAMVRNTSFLHSQDANALRETHRAGGAFQWSVNPGSTDYDKVFAWRATPESVRE